MDITKTILSQLVAQLNDTYDDINLYAAFCTAFAAFLRLGEFTWDSWSAESHLTSISRGSITFTIDGNVLLHLPVSKTDPYRQGTTIPLAASHDSTCPITALLRLFNRYNRPPSAPLFARSFGPFNHSWVLERLHSALLLAGINPTGFSGHSFRRGAANSALAAGIAHSDVMRLGRWKSNAIDRYFSSASETQNLLTLSHQLHSRPGPSTSTPESDS
jgi:hypothetical protein